MGLVMGSRKKRRTWINIWIKSGKDRTFRWKGQDLAVGEILNGDGHPHRGPEMFSLYSLSLLSL